MSRLSRKAFGMLNGRIVRVSYSESQAMNEKDLATELANKVLTQTRDPDDDLAILARQFSRSLARVAELEKVIAEAICFPSAGLPLWERKASGSSPDIDIQWLQDKITIARSNHSARLR